MSTLKVNKLRDTSGSADAITLDPSGGAVLAGVTTVSTVKVGSGVTISSDGDVFSTGISTCLGTSLSGSVIVGSAVTISESGIEASGSTTDFTVNTNNPHNGPTGVMCYGDNTIANDGYVHFVLDAEL